MFKSLAIVFAVLCSMVLIPSMPTQAASDDRCFAETGFCISGQIRSYWERNGGLPVFGFPTSEFRSMDIEGNPFMAQNFERNRLELHPENKAPYDVLIGRVGALNMTALEQAFYTNPVIFAAEDYDTMALPGGELYKNTPQVAKFFPQTKFFVTSQFGFLQYWQTHGLQLDGKKSISEAESLALFGLPLTQPFTSEDVGNGSYVTQIFERARFEYHPENPEPYKVLLGLLGNEFLTNKATACESDTQDIMCALESDPEFSILVALLKTAGMAGELKGRTPYTIFAPHNGAFQAFTAENNFTVEQLNTDPLLRKLLLAHIMQGKQMQADFTKMEFWTSGDRKISWHFIEVRLLVDNAFVLVADNVVGNGVIHVIHGVIIGKE